MFDRAFTVQQESMAIRPCSSETFVWMVDAELTVPTKSGCSAVMYFPSMLVLDHVDL